MNELRWILLGIGLVLLALIYVFSRRTAIDDNALPPVEPRYEPSLSPDDEAGFDADIDIDTGFGSDEVATGGATSRFAPHSDEPAQAQAQAHKTHESTVTSVLDEPEVPADTPNRESVKPPPESTATPVMPEKVIALHLMPKSGQVFEGLDFIGAIQAEGLKFGRFDIFHRFQDPENATDATPSQFSLANMIKPGTFNLLDIDSQQFKGASLFLVLPGPEDGVAAFADMVATGRRLAATLDGQLLDSQGTALSRQSASHLREDIINYQHGLCAAPAE